MPNLLFMQIDRTENEMIIRETPGCLWIFGLFFAFVGGIFVYGSLGGLSDYERQAAWMLAIAFVMGTIGVAAGIWIIYGAPVTRVVINRIDDEILIRRYGLFGKRESFFAFEEIEEFFLIEEKDSEGDKVWSLGMRLTDGETIKISSLPSHDEGFKRDFVFQTNEFMGRQMPSAQEVLALEDESGGEIS